MSLGSELSAIRPCERVVNVALELILAAGLYEKIGQSHRINVRRTNGTDWSCRCSSLLNMSLGISRVMFSLTVKVRGPVNDGHLFWRENGQAVPEEFSKIGRVVSEIDRILHPSDGCPMGGRKARKLTANQPNPWLELLRGYNKS